MAERIPVVTVTEPAAGSRMICHRGTPSMSMGVRFTFGSGTGRLPLGVSAAGTSGSWMVEGVRPPVATRMRGFVRVGQILGKSLQATDTRRRWPAGTQYDVDQKATYSSTKPPIAHSRALHLNQPVETKDPVP